MIEQQTIDAITARVEAGNIHEQNISMLREAFPGLHFTWCMDDDVGCDSPLLEREKFNIYLVNGQGHCLTLTTDLSLANGVVIAEIVAD